MLKPTIAFFIKTYLPASETFIYEEIKNLTTFNVIVLAQKLVNVNLFPHRNIFSAPTHLKWRVGSRWPSHNWFIKPLLSHRVKLVHSHFGWGGMMILPECKKLCLPLLTSFHGIDVSLFARDFIYRLRLKKLFREGSVFLVRSNRMKADVIDLGCSPEKIIVHYGGVDVNRFRFRKKRLDGERIKILMCGRFVEKKGFEYGIRAFAKLGKIHKNVALNIIGDGKLRGKLENLVDSLNLSHRVQFLGMLPHEEVQRKMEASDIFLSPNVTASDGNREGIPNTIKEAMATGLPVVSTYHAGIPELVIDRKTGFLVPEKDVEGLVDRLDQLITHPELWEKLGSRGREVVEEKFNLFKQVRKLEKIYKSLLN
ncbi:MAG: glycosyltransferase [bacterium]